MNLPVNGMSFLAQESSSYPRYMSWFLGIDNNQKLLRVKQIENNAGKTIVSEGLDANYQDMVNYAVFAMIHLESDS